MLSFPFDSYVTYDEDGTPSYDRAVSSQPLRTIIRKLFSSGVMPNPSTNLQVSAGVDGMTVIVSPGFAVVDGGLCKEDNSRTLSVTAADATLDRIDTVILRWNENVDVRTADLYIKAGTPAETPTRPTLERDESIYEIGLADVFITHGVATITNDKITDTRYESERCGIVSSVSEWDTTTIYQQVQADLAAFKSGEETNFDTWMNAEMSDFETWVQTIHDILDDETAGHLQLEIEDLQHEVDLLKETSSVTDFPTSGTYAGTIRQTFADNSYKVTSFPSSGADAGKIVDTLYDNNDTVKQTKKTSFVNGTIVVTIQ